ncbi:MAG: hypothetical protein EPO26_07890 [Chloroflexota bacterium]|nr:MAG: hypothetical protein EPO26_07890 [Chloroflexota bacterium]
MLTTTFYSFKGGVGRSMLATNVAALLADAGQRVLLVDFDLEAPGISYLPEFAPADGPLPRGVVGYLLDCWDAKQAQDARRYWCTVTGFDDRLSFMPAGNVVAGSFADDATRFHDAHLFQFHKQRDRGNTVLGFLRELRNQWARRFDYVLIDSRTGLTDIGGVCTRVLPDIVVMVTSLNRQNLTGTRLVLRQILGESIFGVRVQARVVVSLVPVDVPRTVQERRAALKEALGDLDIPSIELPLVPPLLVREEPFYVRQDAGQSDALVLRYRDVTLGLRGLNEWDVEHQVDEAESALRRGEAFVAERLLRRLVDSDDSPIQVDRRVDAVNRLATSLFYAPGDLSARFGRQSSAIAALRGATTVAGSSTESLSRTLGNLAALLRDVTGDTQSRTAHLDESISILRRLLEVFSRDRYPAEHATTRNNLAAALTELTGDAASRAANLAEAIGQYRAALEIWTRDRYPAEHATTRNNLANALTKLTGDAASRAANLTEAIGHYRAALEIWTRDRYPAEHAMTRNNLANALTELTGDAASRAANLTEAIGHYRAALEIRTRDRYPAEHATTRNNLAAALTDLPGDGATRAANLTEAIGHYRAALEIQTRDRYPTEHAMTLNNLAAALTVLPGDAASRAANLTEAIGLYRAALEIRTRDRYPAEHATTRNNLANALTELTGDAASRAANLAEAIGHYRAALEIWTRDRYPAEHAMTLNNLANALTQLTGDAASRAANLTEAIGHHRAALEIFTENGMEYRKPTIERGLERALALQRELLAGPPPRDGEATTATTSARAGKRAARLK